MHLLIVEDDDAIAAPLARGLEREGFTRHAVATGRRRSRAEGYDLVLLDLGMPDMDGFDDLSRAAVALGGADHRGHRAGDESDRVVGLELGADDYLVKPFGFRELVARIRAVTRRAASRPVDDADAARRSARSSSTSARTASRSRARSSRSPPRSSTCSRSSPRSPARSVTRTTILERVWDPHWYGPTKTLDVHVASVRKKLGDPRWIETVRGVGFRLVDPAA